MEFVHKHFNVSPIINVSGCKYLRRICISKTLLIIIITIRSRLFHDIHNEESVLSFTKINLGANDCFISGKNHCGHFNGT